MAAVLRAALALVDESQRQKTRPDFTRLRAMLFYIDEFPEKHHHRKESELLFPALRARTPLSRHLLERLDDDHACAEHNIRSVEHALAAFEFLGEPRRVEFEEAMARYADFYMMHMAVEETEVFPLAEQALIDEDWQQLDEAFSHQAESGVAQEERLCFAALLARISG